MRLRCRIDHYASRYNFSVLHQVRGAVALTVVCACTSVYADALSGNALTVNTSSAQTNPAARTVAKDGGKADTNASSATTAAPTGRYVVKPGQSLDEVARDVSGTGDARTVAKVARGLAAENPTAFVIGDPNRLRADAILKIPRSVPSAPAGQSVGKGASGLATPLLSTAAQTEVPAAVSSPYSASPASSAWPAASDATIASTSIATSQLPASAAQPSPGIAQSPVFTPVDATPSTGDGRPDDQEASFGAPSIVSQMPGFASLKLVGVGLAGATITALMLWLVYASKRQFQRNQGSLGKTSADSDTLQFALSPESVVAKPSSENRVGASGQIFVRLLDQRRRPHANEKSRAKIDQGIPVSSPTVEQSESPRYPTSCTGNNVALEQQAAFEHADAAMDINSPTQQPPASESSKTESAIINEIEASRASADPTEGPFVDRLDQAIECIELGDLAGARERLKILIRANDRQCLAVALAILFALAPLSFER